MLPGNKGSDPGPNTGGCDAACDEIELNGRIGGANIFEVATAWWWGEFSPWCDTGTPG